MSDDCEVPSFYKTTEPVAAKAHKCCECRTAIPVGEKHLYAKIAYDGHFETYRQHMLCAETCMFVRDNLNDGDCIYYGGLFDWYKEEGYGSLEYKTDDDVKTFRDMMAKIIRRKRSEKRMAAAA